MFLLRRHYRQDFEFFGNELAGRSDDLIHLPAGSAAETLREANLREAFYAALDNDLDTPTALRILDAAEESDDPKDRALVEEGQQLLGLDV